MYNSILKLQVTFDSFNKLMVWEDSLNLTIREKFVIDGHELKEEKSIYNIGKGRYKLVYNVFKRQSISKDN